jgi:Zn-dependent oligopeptidase
MESLNQHRGLYSAMKRLQSSTSLTSSMSAEEVRVTESFTSEMEEHGIGQ